MKVDCVKLARTWLLTCNALTGALTDRNGSKSIYIGDLPEYVDPRQGPAVTITVRGGVPEVECPVYRPSLQVKVWAGPMQYQVAEDIARTIFDFMHGMNNISFGSDGTILASICSLDGQQVDDPDTGWACAISFYELMVRN